MPVAVLVDGRPGDVLHHQVWKVVVGRPAVQKAGDILVLEACQNLTLLAKPSDDEVGSERILDYFDRDFLAVFAIVSNCQIDGSHPAAPDLAQDSVRPDPQGTLRLASRTLDPGHAPSERGLLDEALRLFGGQQQRLERQRRPVPECQAIREIHLRAVRVEQRLDFTT